MLSILSIPDRQQGLLYSKKIFWGKVPLLALLLFTFFSTSLVNVQTGYRSSGLKPFTVSHLPSLLSSGCWVVLSLESIRLTAKKIKTRSLFPQENEEKNTEMQPMSLPISLPPCKTLYELIKKKNLKNKLKKHYLITAE